MPKPGPEHENLKLFVGERRGVDKMYPTQWSPQGGNRDARVSNRLALGGFAVVQDYEQLDAGVSMFKGYAVIVKNPQASSC